VIEAMASGLAIVATRVGAVPEMIRDGRDGLLVHPGHPEELAQALEKLVGSPQLRKDLGTSARTRARERYDLDRLRERIADLYRPAAASR
jgi:glycosyltransferase involved in cell wall biosynthesis